MIAAMPTFNVGDVFKRGDRHRRVIAIFQEHVIYCRGGEMNLACKVETFKRWAKSKHVVRVDKEKEA